MKKMPLIFMTVSILVAICISCENRNVSYEEGYTPKNVNDYDPKRGLGKFEDIELGTLNADKAKKGRAIYEAKCRACHKLTEELLVGPGWAGVSFKHRPEWLLNFITNPDPMLDMDPELQAQLELCLVRMPNQFLADEEAYAIVEFMRQNDGVE